MTERRYNDLRALFINCTLKRSPEPSNTARLIEVSTRIMEKHGVQVEVLRAIDHDIATTSATPSRRRPTRVGSAKPDRVVLSGPRVRRTGQRLHQPEHHLHDLEPDASRSDAQRRRRHPRPRQPALGMGGRLSVRLREPRLPMALPMVQVGRTGTETLRAAKMPRP